MCTLRLVVFSLVCFLSCHGQTEQTQEQGSRELHHGLSEKIGNFSIELLYHSTLQQEKNGVLIISPVTVWTALAVIAEGATERTLKEICETIRVSPWQLNVTRRQFREIAQWLQVNTTTVELQKFNAIFVDDAKRPSRDFVDTAADYDTKMISANFSDTEQTISVINSAISQITKGHIPKLVTRNDLAQSEMVLTSALYFKGQWTAPFNSSLTTRMPFFDSNGDPLGEVNMMYNRYTYPWANMKALSARILEIPYGKENRLSMLIMLPNPGVSLQDMFWKFNTVSLDAVFDEIKKSAEMYGDEEADLYLPRFKIESSLVLTDVLQIMGIRDLFDERYARLPKLARRPVYVTKVIHKAEIEVTEEGTTAAGVTVAEFANRIGNNRFEVNRPFVYLIVEKVTNTITFGGFYRKPSLY